MAMTPTFNTEPWQHPSILTNLSIPCFVLWISLVATSIFFSLLGAVASTLRALSLSLGL